MSRTITEPQRTIAVLDEVDVVVAGAGVTGVAAAIGAARAGARTLLIERTGLFGGVTTAALMTSLSNWLITGDGRQVVKGICEEILDHLVERGATSPQWRSRAVPQIVFDQETFRTVLVELVLEAGVEVLVETWVAGVVKEGDALKGIIVESKGGRQAVLCKVAVDATGDADLAASAGAPYRHTPPDHASLLFLMAHVDLDKTVEYFVEHPQEWQQYSDLVTPLEDFVANWRERGIFHLPHWGAKKMRLVREAIERGDYFRHKGLCRDVDVFGLFAYRGTDEVLINSLNFEVDNLDPRAHSRAELEGRRIIPEIAEFLRKFWPGFEEAIVVQSAPMVGVRWTRWIDAGFDLTREHVAEGAQFEDVIGVVAAWDIHPKGGLVFPPRSADLPYRIMLPQKVENLIVASGKSVSTDGPAGGYCVRDIVSCHVFGQAAGVAAAIAARTGVGPRDVPIREVQAALLAQNVYLGEPDRLAELGLD